MRRLYQERAFPRRGGRGETTISAGSILSLGGGKKKERLKKIDARTTRHLPPGGPYVQAVEEKNSAGGQRRKKKGLSDLPTPSNAKGETSERRGTHAKIGKRERRALLDSKVDVAPPEEDLALARTGGSSYLRRRSLTFFF